MESDYEHAVAQFTWDTPPRFNLGELLSDRQARLGRGTAIISVGPDGTADSYTFDYLSLFSNKLANLLVSIGAAEGDRIAVLLPASVEAAVAHFAILKSGLISVPLIADDAIGYFDRLEAAGVTAICTTAAVAETWSPVWRELPTLRKVIVVTDGIAPGSGSRMERILESYSGSYRALACTADQPAILSFTSGSEGTPKGVLHGHGLVFGITPALLFTGLPKPEDIVWSHFDWGWLGGLLVALGAWHYGSAVLVHGNDVLSPPRTIDVLRRFAVTRVSIAPTALKMLQLGTRTMEFPQLSSITTGGEKLDPATVEWVQERFGLELAEIYGLTECSAVMGSGRLVPRRHGALGKPAPGQRLALVADDRTSVGPGQVGQLAVQAPHPAMFLGYWNDEEATRARFRGPLLLTGDLMTRDEDGYFHYVARADDVIKRAGRRIGPGEIEDVIGQSRAVDLCAAVGVPDPLSGQRIVVWVKLAPTCPASADTEATIMAEARRRLPLFQLPDALRFVDDIPVTANGKVHRRAVREAELAASTRADES